MTGSITYSFASGIGDEDNYQFLLDGDQLKADWTFDFAVKQVYVVRIKASTPESSKEEFFIIEVMDTPAEPVGTPCTDVFESMGYGYTDIQVVSSGQLFTITNDGKILRSLNSGMTWQPLNTARWGRLNSIFFKGSSGVYFRRLCYAEIR